MNRGLMKNISVFFFVTILRVEYEIFTENKKAKGICSKNLTLDSFVAKKDSDFISKFIQICILD